MLFFCMSHNTGRKRLEWSLKIWRHRVSKICRCPTFCVESSRWRSPHNYRQGNVDDLYRRASISQPHVQPWKVTCRYLNKQSQSYRTTEVAVVQCLHTAVWTPRLWILKSAASVSPTTHESQLIRSGSQEQAQSALTAMRHLHLVRGQNCNICLACTGTWMNSQLQAIPTSIYSTTALRVKSNGSPQPRVRKILTVSQNRSMGIERQRKQEKNQWAPP